MQHYHLLLLALISSMATSAFAISCETTFTGDLGFSSPLRVRTGRRGGSDFSFIPAYLDDDQLISASVEKGKAALKVQFEACTVQGWNAQSQEYGWIRLAGNASDCIHVIEPFNLYSNVAIESCQDQPGDLLQAQWFHFFVNKLKRYPSLIPTGNPNNPRSIRHEGVKFRYMDEDPDSNAVTVQPQTGLEFIQFTIKG